MRSHRIVDIESNDEVTARSLIISHNKVRIQQKLRQFLIVIIILVIILGCIYIAYDKFTNTTTIFSDIYKYASILSSFAIVFLTTGLLIATWRYTNLTSAMLKVVRDTQSFDLEPKVYCNLWPFLQPEENSNVVFDFVTNISIYNVGKIPILDPNLQIYMGFERFDRKIEYSGIHVYQIKKAMESQTINPNEIINITFGCNKTDIEDYNSKKEYKIPFAVLKFKYRDSYGRLYSLTQDYILSSIGENKMILDFELLSTPSLRIYRKGEKRLLE